MFNLHEVFRRLNETVDESDRPEIIKIDVVVQPEELTEGLPSPKDTVYDEQTLEDWYDFAATVEGIIDNYCDTVNISLSKNPNSLSEYIDFYVYDENGDIKNYLINLRLSTHGGTDGGKRLRKKKVQKVSSKYELVSIIVNNQTFRTYHQAINAVRKLLAEHSLKD